MLEILKQFIEGIKAFILFEKQLNQCAKIFGSYNDSELARFMRSQKKKFLPYLGNKAYLMKKDGHYDAVVLSLLKLGKNV